MEEEIDFGNAGNKVVNNSTTGKEVNNGNNTSVTEEVTPIDGKPDKEDVTAKDGNSETSTNKEDGEKNTEKKSGKTDDNPSTGELSEGTIIEFEGVTYKVDKDGNIVDKDNKVFKEAKDVKSWLNDMNIEDDDKTEKVDKSSFNLSSIQEALGVVIEDSEGNPIEFTDSIDGIKSYVNSVIDLKTKETQETAINTLYANKPYLKEVDDYYIANGGSLRGFGQLPDRSGIKLDKDNLQQLEYVIRAAAEEFGNKSLDDKYIKYLKDTGSLYDVAQEQLNALVEKDKATKKDYESKAKAIQEKEKQDVLAYWKTVNDTIATGTIGGYKIPESFTKTVDGKKVNLTRNDFYEYLSKPIKDENGNNITAYQRDLYNMSDEDYLNAELIDAWLKFTGGSYKDLVDMAIKEEQVRTLRMRAKEQRTNKTVKISPKVNSKVNFDDIVL